MTRQFCKCNCGYKEKTSSAPMERMKCPKCKKSMPKPIKEKKVGLKKLGEKKK